MTDLATTTLWIAAFGAIWLVFYKKDETGANMEPMGDFAFLINGIIGSIVEDSAITLLILGVIVVYIALRVPKYVTWGSGQ
jgi:hypothetical protein